MKSAEKLFNSNLDLAREMAAITRATGIEYDERLQAARIGLWHACQKWRPDGGASVRTYAVYWIRSAIGTEARRLRKWQAKPNDSLDEEVGGYTNHEMTRHEIVPDTTAPTPEATSLDNARHTTLQDAASRVLRQRARHGTVWTASEVVKLLSDGYTMAEIGRRYNVSRERVRQVVATIREAAEVAA